jgi:IS1 family transposase
MCGGKRNNKTASKLREKLASLGISFDTVYSDNWSSFCNAFSADNHVIGKMNTVGIEGNTCTACTVPSTRVYEVRGNCRLRHRVRRALRKTCCFSKKMLNHMKAFSLAFFYTCTAYEVRV